MERITTTQIAEQRCRAQMLRLQLARIPHAQRSQHQHRIAVAEHEFQRLTRAMSAAPQRR
jgi:hypothetical protein